MLTYFISSTVALFIVQMLIGFIWYSMIFIKPFKKYTKCDPDQNKNTMKHAMIMQMVFSISQGFVITFCVFIIPPQHSMLAIAIYYLLLVWLIPIIALEKNVWVKTKHTILIFIDSAYTAVSLGAMFVVAFYIKSFC